MGEVGAALKEHLRIQKRMKRGQRSESSRSLRGHLNDRLHGARLAHNRSASCGALQAAPQPQPRRPGRQEWVVHDEAWEKFQDAPPDPLYVEMVPWPPHSDDVLDYYEQIHGLG